MDAATRALAAVPFHGRAVAAIVTALAGLALAFIAAHAMVTRPIASEGGRAPGWGSLSGALAFVFACAALSVLAFHAAAAGRMRAEIATLPPLVMLVGALPAVSSDSMADQPGVTFSWGRGARVVAARPRRSGRRAGRRRRETRRRVPGGCGHRRRDPSRRWKRARCRRACGRRARGRCVLQRWNGRLLN